MRKQFYDSEFLRGVLMDMTELDETPVAQAAFEYLGSRLNQSWPGNANVYSADLVGILGEPEAPGCSPATIVKEVWAMAEMC